MTNYLKFLFTLSVALSCVACSDQGTADDHSDTKGGEQIQEPVLNSGPETEAERATDAVDDSLRGSERGSTVPPDSLDSRRTP